MVLREHNAGHPQDAAPAPSASATTAAMPIAADRATNAAQLAPPDAARVSSAARNDDAATHPVATLSLSVPAQVATGDAVDLLLGGSVEIPVRRIALKIQFDPTLLRVRSSEEIDYAGAIGVGVRFAVENTDGGEIVVTAEAADGVMLPTFAHPIGIVQFEAVGRGWANIHLVASAIVDRTGKAIDVVLAPATVQVAIN